MPERRVKFPCGDIQLEGILHVPQGEGPFPGVVVCHPHPLYGGDMDNNVVWVVSEALARASVIALRFNFRGVGDSQGHFDQGIGEQGDIKAAISLLSFLEMVDRNRIGLCGYSFGAGLAFSVAPADERVQAVAAISLPVSNSGAQIRNYARPKFIICGSRDMLTPSVDAERLAAELAEPKKIETISGADHFWLGYEQGMAEAVTDFFVEALSSPPQ